MRAEERDFLEAHQTHQVTAGRSPDEHDHDAYDAARQHQGWPPQQIHVVVIE